MGKPQGVHLVGSVPLEDNLAVFETACACLGDHLKRLPDGETKERTNWINWQFPMLAGMPQFEVVPVPPDRYPPIPTVKLREGVTPDQVTFNDLGYARVALESYARFAELKAAGRIPAALRFQVCLPTPLATVHIFVEPPDRAAVEPAYHARMLVELQTILDGIPHDQLAIQWDTAVEFGLIEGVFVTYYQDVQGEIIQRLLELGNAVPADVEMGFHLCYGDSEHRHFVQPKDAGHLVTVANAVAAGLTRPLHWLHLPIPRDRTDDAYYAPLAHLKLHPDTELYLGLVHMTDGVEGTQARIAAAQKVVPQFGVATECGFGRRPANTVEVLMKIHTAVSAPVR